MLNHLIRRSLAGGLVIAAASFPATAQAMFTDGGGASSPATITPAAHPPVATSNSSFQWGDAGIGAAGATVLLGAGALGVGATRRRGRPVAS